MAGLRPIKPRLEAALDLTVQHCGCGALVFARLVVRGLQPLRLSLMARLRL
jgi:hypothetical protein